MTTDPNHHSDSSKLQPKPRSTGQHDPEVESERSSCAAYEDDQQVARKSQPTSNTNGLNEETSVKRSQSKASEADANDELRVSIAEVSESPQWQWWSQIVALLIWLNLMIDVFDRSYPSLEGLYTQYLPSIADFYAPIHGQGLLYIDKYFIALFGLDFLVRTLVSSYRKQTVTWGDAMLRRWYDIFLLLPIWRWLRIIPALVRSHQSRLFNMARILSQITHEPAAYLADRVSVFLLVRLINQTRESVKSGEAAQFLFEPKKYIQVSKVNKAEAILDRLLKLSIYKVLPRVQPELEAVLHYNLDSAVKQSSFYQGLLNIPGVDTLPEDVIEQLSAYLAQFTYDTLATYYADTRGRELLDRLTQDFRTALQEELQDEATRIELQSLLSDLLEEIKVNYVQQSVDYNPEETLEEADQLQQQMEEMNEREDQKHARSPQPKIGGEHVNLNAESQPLLEEASSENASSSAQEN